VKALILSGGSGTRLRPLTYSQQKQLIPVANKPVLFYAIEDVIEAGVDEIGIILGPNKEQVIDTVNSKEWDVPIEFIYQGEPKGLAHTIIVAEKFLDDDFVMYLGDNILRDGIVRHEKRFCSLKSDASVLLTKVDDLSASELPTSTTMEASEGWWKSPKSLLPIMHLWGFTSSSR